MAKKIPLEDVTDVLDAADAEYKNNQHSTEETLAVLDEAEDPYKLKIPKMAPRNVLKDTGGNFLGEKATPSLSLLDVSKATNAALDDKPMPQLGRAVDNLSLATDALAKRRGGKAAMGLDDKGNAVELTEKDKYKELSPEEIEFNKVTEMAAANKAKREALPDNPTERAKLTHEERKDKFNEEIKKLAFNPDGTDRDPDGIDPETNKKYTKRKRQKIIFSQSARTVFNGYDNPNTGAALDLTDLNPDELRDFQRGTMEATESAFGMGKSADKLNQLAGKVIDRIVEEGRGERIADRKLTKDTRDVQRKAEQLAVAATQNQVEGQAKVEAYRKNPDDPKVEADYLNWQSTELELLENADPKKEDFSQDIHRADQMIQANIQAVDKISADQAKDLEGLDPIDDAMEISKIKKAYSDRIGTFQTRINDFKKVKSGLEKFARQPKSTVIKGKEKDVLARADAKERANDPSRAKLQKSMPLPDVPVPTEKAKEVAGPDNIYEAKDITDVASRFDRFKSKEAIVNDASGNLYSTGGEIDVQKEVKKYTNKFTQQSDKDSFVNAVIDQGLKNAEGMLSKIRQKTKNDRIKLSRKDRFTILHLEARIKNLKSQKVEAKEKE